MQKKTLRKIATIFIFLSIFCQIPHVSLAKNAKKTTKTINGDLSTHISISEVFPNPKGIDSNKEWVELLNHGNQNINLGNWSLNITNSSTNSKPKILKFSNKTILKANSYLVLESTIYKFSLPNSNCKIELKDFVGKIIDTIEYGDSEENLSLARINISDKNKTITTWTNPTKGIANPIYYEISGRIEEKNITENQNAQNYLKIKTNNDKSLNIYLSTKNNIKLLNTTLKEKDQILFLVEKNKENQFSLINFKIEQQNQEANNTNDNGENWLYYSIIPILIGFIYLFKKLFI